MHFLFLELFIPKLCLNNLSSVQSFQPQTLIFLNFLETELLDSDELNSSVPENKGTKYWPKQENLQFTALPDRVLYN